MPRFRIICTTTRTYWLTVEAPSKEAAEKYYDGCTGEEFHSGQEEGWNLDEIVPLSPDEGTGHDVEVDEDGEVTPAPATTEDY